MGWESCSVTVQLLIFHIKSQGAIFRHKHNWGSTFHFIWLKNLYYEHSVMFWLSKSLGTVHAWYEPQYTCLSCPSVCFIRLFAGLIRPKFQVAIAHCLKNFPHFYELLWYHLNLSLIRNYCRQSCVFFSSSPVPTGLCRSICVLRFSNCLKCTALASVFDGVYLVVYDYRSGRLTTECHQHTVWERYRPFWETLYEFLHNTLSRTSFNPCASSSLFVGLSVCIRSVFMTLWREVTTITRESVSAGFFNCFAIRIVACPFQHYTPWVTVCSISWTYLFLCTRFVPVRDVSTRSFCPWRRFPWCKGQCMWCAVISLLVSSPANYVRAFWGPISKFNRMIHSTLTNSFVAVQSFGASRRLMRYFQCCLK